MESQVSGLTHFTTADETDPVFTAWDKQTGIEIYGAQVINFTPDTIIFSSAFGGLMSTSLLNWEPTQKRLGVNKLNPTSTIDVGGTVKATGMKVGGANVLTSETDPIFIA